MEQRVLEHEPMVANGRARHGRPERRVRVNPRRILHTCPRRATRHPAQTAPSSGNTRRPTKNTVAATAKTGGPAEPGTPEAGPATTEARPAKCLPSKMSSRGSRWSSAISSRRSRWNRSTPSSNNRCSSARRRLGLLLLRDLRLLRGQLQSAGNSGARSMIRGQWPSVSFRLPGAFDCSRERAAGLEVRGFCRYEMAKACDWSKSRLPPFGRIERVQLPEAICDG